MLYPQSNAKRSTYSLNGIWKFATVGDDYDAGVPLKKGMLMPVPASFNELVTSEKLRDYVGCVVYERDFGLPTEKDRIYRLRIGATSHKCKVYLNGELIGEGKSGFYPVDIPLSALQKTNRLSVVVDNRLDFQTIPPGKIEPDGRQTINFDFYNFTGIHRDVIVYSLPKKYIEDVVINTVVGGDYKKISVALSGNINDVLYTVKDEDGKVVAKGENGDITISEPKLWQPLNPYLYTLEVDTGDDFYTEKFGIRKVAFDSEGLYINDEKVYLCGFGMHEDFFLSGKGNNPAVNIRNFELLKWIDANSIRTSHYPYAEEIMNLADEYGIMVIDEVPAVGMNAFRGEGNFTPNRLNDKTKELHKSLVKELIERDKNHPCVIMMSVANEPATEEESSRAYFKDIIDYTRTLTDLPITLPEVTKFNQDSKAGDLVDFTSLNRYYGWYEEHGHLYKTEEMLVDELVKWHDKFGKPIIISEFGADTIEGLHALPSEAFSEEYQRDFIKTNCETFDKLPFVVGEHVWNFADFKTKEGVIRVRGNRKGVFTKERQPKTAAFYLKDRWQIKGGKK